MRRIATSPLSNRIYLAEYKEGEETPKNKEDVTDEVVQAAFMHMYGKLKQKRADHPEKDIRSVGIEIEGMGELTFSDIKDEEEA